MTSDAMLHCPACRRITEHVDKGGRQDRRVSKCTCLECGKENEAMNTTSAAVKGISAKAPCRR